MDIIKRRNNNLIEEEKIEKKLLKASIFTFKQSILKNSLKDSIRQIKCLSLNQKKEQQLMNY